MEGRDGETIGGGKWTRGKSKEGGKEKGGIGTGGKPRKEEAVKYLKERRSGAVYEEEEEEEEEEERRRRRRKRGGKARHYDPLCTLRGKYCKYPRLFVLTAAQEGEKIDFGGKKGGRKSKRKAR